jgi:hypothetical protein
MMVTQKIYKQCASCGRYYQGEMNGSYRCIECHCKEMPAAPPRSLTSLDSLASPVGVPLQPAPRAHRRAHRAA